MEKDCSDGTCRSGHPAPHDGPRDARKPTARCCLVHRGCPLKVLIVEDDMIVTTDMIAMVEEHGGAVIGTAADSLRAIKLSLERYPDTVLMDVVLRGQSDGIDAAQVIRDLVGATIVFCTANNDPETLHRMEAVDGAVIVKKPVLSLELCRAIRTAIRKDRRG